MIEHGQRPRLSSEARLRFDRHLQRYLLLDPESGVLLSAGGAAIVQLCTGHNTVAQIVQQLSDVHGSARDSVERDVHAFLGELLERALVSLED
jgi:pyrroloquinoline quinone biosynthesis protein D